MLESEAPQSPDRHTTREQYRGFRESLYVPHTLVVLEGIMKDQRAKQGLVAKGYYHNVANPPGPGHDYTHAHPEHARTPKALYKAHSSDIRRGRKMSAAQAKAKAAEKTKKELENDPRGGERGKWRDPDHWEPKTPPKVGKRRRKQFYATMGGDRETH